jgi:hypothetical protein
MIQYLTIVGGTGLFLALVMIAVVSIGWMMFSSRWYGFLAGFVALAGAIGTMVYLSSKILP